MLDMLVENRQGSRVLGENHTMILVSKLSQQLNSYRTSQDCCSKTTSLRFACTFLR